MTRANSYNFYPVTYSVALWFVRESRAAGGANACNGTDLFNQTVLLFKKQCHRTRKAFNDILTGERIVMSEKPEICLRAIHHHGF